MMIWLLLGFCLGGFAWAGLQLLVHYVLRRVDQAFAARDQAMGDDVDERTGPVAGWTPRVDAR